MPELSRNRNHGERLKCGNSRRVLDSSPHRFSKLVQPDVPSCWSTEQQRSLSPCCGRVSRTPSPGQAHSPHSYGWDVLCSAPHSTGAAGSGTDVSLPQFQVALQHQQIRHSSTWHRRKLRQEAPAQPQPAALPSRASSTDHSTHTQHPGPNPHSAHHPHLLPDQAGQQQVPSSQKGASARRDAGPEAA